MILKKYDTTLISLSNIFKYHPVETFDPRIFLSE